MNRKIKFAFIFFIVLVPCMPYISLSQSAPEQGVDSVWNVLPFPYETMMDNHFRRIASELNFKKNLPETPEEYQSYRHRIVKELWKSFGWQPKEKTPLNPVITGRVDKGDYIIEKLLFESQPGIYVTANVYVPKNVHFPVPAVLCPHGHWQYAKHQPQVQSRGIGLAKLGYIALILDAYGFGERKPIGHTDAFYLFPTGITLEGLQIWDNMRAVDYLISRPDVDPLHIGITGASGGGNQTIYTGALDERLTAVVPVASMCTFEGLFFRGIGCVCETTPNILRYADLPDVSSVIAPRALLFDNTIQDPIFPIWAARDAFFQTGSIYNMLGVRNKLNMVEIYAKHDYNQEEREAMYTWMEKFLKGKDVDYISEPSLTPEPVDSPDLKVLPQEGQFPKPVKTLLELNAEVAQQLPPSLQATSPEEWHTLKFQIKSRLINDIFGGFPQPGIPPVQNYGKVTKIPETNGINNFAVNYTFEKIVYRSEPDILIPAILAIPKNQTKPVPAAVLINSNGKMTALKDKLFTKLLSENCAVLIPDLRGTGETNGPGYSGSKDTEFIPMRNSIVSGRHILGERVVDVKKGVEYLMSRTEIDGGKISVIGKGAAGVIALISGALEEHIASVVCEEIPISYKSREGYNLPYSIFVPNILKVADIPELAGLIAPRKLMLLNSVDTMNKPLPASKAEQSFIASEKIYEIEKTRHNLKIITVNADTRESTIVTWLK